MNEKYKAIFLVNLIILVMSVSYIFYGYRQHNDLLGQIVQSTEQSIDTSINSLEEFAFAPYSVRIHNLLETNPRIPEAFAQRDRDLLYEHVQSHYQAFQAENNFFHVMHFHLPDSTTFLRMHNPTFFGDNLKNIRPIVDAVHAEKTLKTGFEIGRHGPYYRIISPIFYENKYIGALEIGFQTHQLLSVLQKVIEFPCTTFFQRQLLQKTTNIPEDALRTFGNYSLMTHDQPIFNNLPRNLDLTQGEQKITLQDRWYACHSYQVFKDYQGNLIGGIVVLHDISSFVQQKRNFLLRTALLTALLLLLSFLVLYLGFGKIMDDLLKEIRQRRKTEHRLRQAAAVFENTTEGVVITDADANILAVNRAFCAISGFTEEEAIGQNPRLWKSNRHDRAFYQTMWSSLLKTGQWQGEIWNRRHNGDIHPVWMNISSIRDDQDKPINYISVFSDITSLKQSQEHIQYLAHHDPLTDLPNRLLLNDRLQHALLHAHRTENKLAVIFVDLDNFKQINDSLGHPVGDKVLQEVSKRLRNQIRETDTVARVAGDEFIIILEDMPHSQTTAHIAEKILASFETPFFFGGQQLHITISMGISIYPDDGEDVTTLVKNADAAMFRTKESGKNNYSFYTAELTEAALERLKLENELRVALSKQQLQVYYQPQYSLDTGELTGAEALMRWVHPELGLISPVKFIPIAESTGMIVDIGAWILQEACAQAKAWQDAGYDFPRIGVNIAGQQIQRDDLVEKVVIALEQSGLSAQSLELEVTETFIMQRAQKAINTLGNLKQLGVKLAIDDFGTGYSSLSYLKILPIDKLKIDRSFIRDIPRDSNDEAIARAVIALAKSMQLHVIAEGVETEEQQDFLSAEGCEEVQGFLYSRPVAAKEFEEMLQASLSQQ